MSSSQQIYSQYLAYYYQCNAMINTINAQPYPIPEEPSVLADIATIQQQQLNLWSVYCQDYATKTLAEFITDCTGIESLITAAYYNAMGQSPIAAQIALLYTNSQAITAAISPLLTQDSTAIGTIVGNLTSYQQTVTALAAQINALPNGWQKTQAESDLIAASNSLATLTQDTNNAVSQLNSFQTTLNGILAPETGILAQLQALAALSNPTTENLAQANALFAQIENAQNAITAFQSGLFAQVNTDLSTFQTNLATVQADLQPIPPPPPPGTPEHATWMITWTSDDFSSVPQGVNVVNIFVGAIAIVDGQPTVNSFGDMTPAAMQAFVQACHAANPPVAVKISIGGSGGSNGNCWDALNSDNVQAFAQALVDFCHTNRLAGVDMDYEEYASAEQETLVGNLIYQIKALDPTLQISVCANAGYGPDYPWQGVVENIFSGATDPTTGKCLVDRLYIMSYYQPMNEEQAWLTQWADWLSDTYGFSPSQLTVGLDNTDSHAYNIGQFSAWAGTQGFSTGYWEWDPANVAVSNQSTLEIFNDYTPTPLGTLYAVICRFLRNLHRLLGFGVAYNPRQTQQQLSIARERQKRRAAATATYPLPSAPPIEPEIPIAYPVAGSLAERTITVEVPVSQQPVVITVAGGIIQIHY